MKSRAMIKLPFITYYQIFYYIRLVAFYKYGKSSIKPPLSNKPPLFRWGKLISPPPPPRSILILHRQFTWTDQLWFIQGARLEVHTVFGLWPHDLQLHVLKFFNFTH